ncbi:MAG: DUF1634 domain-containing protein [Bacteroidales bacterium]
MRKKTNTWNDQQMRTIMGLLLRTGVLSSALLVVLGGILFFFQHPAETFNYSDFQGEPARLTHLKTILGQAFNFHSRAIIQLGLILLIATPVMRVIFSFFGFIFEKDWVYTIITSIVLIILFYSLFV